MSFKQFAQRLAVVAIASTLTWSCQTSSTTDTTTIETFPEDKHGFKVSIGSYSFKEHTFVEALAKMDSCKVYNTEGFPNHTLGGGLEGTLTYKMDTITRNKVLALMNEKGIRMAAYGVITPETPEEWRQLFTFAKAMGVETISSEPAPEQLPMVAQLADEYDIRVAIHNHPAPSRYWHPDSVVNVLQGLSPRIGAAADVGHWLRSGLDPVESLKKLEGRLIHFHMKDLNEKGIREAHDVLWGQGVTNVLGVLEETKRQQFSGIMSIEYEYNWKNNTNDIKQCVEYLRSNL